MSSLEMTKVISDVDAEARAKWRDPAYRAEFAAELTESILLGFDTFNLLDQYINTQNASLEDRVFVREAQGLKAFWVARGGYIEASQLVSAELEIPRDTVGVHVDGMTDQFATNFSYSAQTLRDAAIRRMDAEIHRRALTVLDTATTPVTGITDNATYKAALDNAIRNVSEASYDTVTIVGRLAAVGHIADFAGYSNETQEEIRQNGMIGVYRGCNIVAIKNYKDEDGLSYLPNNQVFVVGKDVGQAAFFGGVLSKEFEELDNWYWHYIIRRDFGIVINHPERAVELTVGY